MSLLDLAIILAAMVLLVAGQLFLKAAMRGAGPMPSPRGRRAMLLGLGIAAMTGWFFLWLGLMQHKDLSHLFPFEGLSSVMLSLAAVAVLKERASVRLWLGVGLVALGVAVVGYG